MAIDQQKEKYASRVGPAYNASGSKTARRIWTVTTTRVMDGISVVASALQIPRIGMTYVTESASDPTLLVIKIEPRQTEQLVWEVSVYYSNEGEGGQQSDNPMEWPVKRQWSSVTYDTFPFADKSTPAKRLTNSAGEVFDPGISVPEHYAVWTWTRNEPYFKHDLAVSFLGKTNQRTWLGQPSNTCLMAAIRGTEANKNGIYYVAVTYEVHVNATKVKAGMHLINDARKTGAVLGWDKPVLDQGSYYWENGLAAAEPDEKPLLPEDAVGYRFTGRVLLDGYGGLIPVETMKKGEAFYHVFRCYEQVDFGPLNLS